MLYRVRHVTAYAYRHEVSVGLGVLRVLPASSAGQTVLSSALHIDPAPVERHDGPDFFGNAVTQVRFATPSRRHRFATDVQVRVEPAPLPPPATTPSWEEVRRQALAARTLGGLAPAHMLFASRFVPLLDAARDEAAACFTPRRPVLEAAEALMRRIHAGFAYDPVATEISTPLAELARHRRGVCQDFAHWMTAGLRGLGLPAAYVSGYLRTLPPPGRPRLVGADASHAWVALWCGEGLGWIGLDPTNAVLQNRDHIQVAMGRDYGDVSPVGGVIYTSAGHSLTVSVDVAPQEEPVPA